MGYNYFDKKRGWKDISTCDKYRSIVQAWEETIDYAKSIGLWNEAIINVKFYLNNQLKAIGSCNWHRYEWNGCYDVGLCLNEHVVEEFDLEVVRETIIHEVAHACTLGDNHGPRWKAACERIGAHWGLHGFSRLERRAAVNASMIEMKRQNCKYMLKCPACGRTWFRARASRAVQVHDKCGCPCGWKGLELVTL